MLHRLQGMTTAGCSVLAGWWLKQLSRITLPARQVFALLVLALSSLMFASPALAQFTQQGPKLVGTGSVGAVLQGSSVAVSGDGNTAIVGGVGNNGGSGVAWIYTRSAAGWSQQGSRLEGTGAVVGTTPYSLPASVAISSDGNTAIVGWSDDNGLAGAAWIYTRRTGVWSQQGNKLVGTGSVGAAGQGWGVSLSADGNTAIVGGSTDNDWTGAAWV